MKYLLDTDTCVALLRGDATATARARQLSPADLAVSSITRYELHFGVMRCSSKRRKSEAKKVSVFLSLLHEIPFTDETAEVAAKIRFQLEGKGQPIGQMDTLIAATALEAGLTLVTGNLRDFSRISDLSVESWMDK
ncbi:type II toxin-antitoxin system VapC family toxin [Puniceicoccales bacterium CK1056]|uniref:Ribonuclease VapC n=1 Tax=Oceanipulchritudo coccoides TaxID=2706888 RepID=A0A6B2M0Y3_9BACT|nr:PIN domain-containing protein [Oceanipulchritudo coccoides]NDV61445.1 type II toxin-antitoxin system VapC family toxin [Oceanipulchritudo coccoides]